MVTHEHTTNVWGSQDRLTVWGQRVAAHVSRGLVHLLKCGYQHRVSVTPGRALTSGCRPTDGIGVE